MSTSLTRRSLVAAAPAVVVVTSLPTLASAYPDAALLALREPYERTLAATLAVAPLHNRAEEAAVAIMRANPGRDRAEVEREVGLDMAEAAWTGALDVNGEVIQQIIDTPARTIEGVIFKARICERESYHSDLADSIVDDLVAMAKGGANA